MNLYILVGSLIIIANIMLLIIKKNHKIKFMCIIFFIVICICIYLKPHNINYKGNEDNILIDYDGNLITLTEQQKNEFEQILNNSTVRRTVFTGYSDTVFDSTDTIFILFSAEEPIGHGVLNLSKNSNGFKNPYGKNMRVSNYIDLIDGGKYLIMDDEDLRVFILNIIEIEVTESYD